MSIHIRAATFDWHSFNRSLRCRQRWFILNLFLIPIFNCHAWVLDAAIENRSTTQDAIAPPLRTANALRQRVHPSTALDLNLYSLAYRGNYWTKLPIRRPAQQDCDLGCDCHQFPDTRFFMGRAGIGLELPIF